MQRKRLRAAEYLAGVLQGDRGILGRAITLVESSLPEDRALAAEVLSTAMPHTGKSFRLGITGPPGVGKSTFIDGFGMLLLEKGYRVAVLAVDPSSQLTHGSILGDKTRMDRLSRAPGAFIRPSPARGALGGVARATREAILLCEAAGFDFIVVETVGVGQSEVAVHGMVDFFLLLMLAGAGDELQGIKKGIMEMADGVLITKADGDNAAPAAQARAEFQKALHLFPRSESGWTVPVLTASSVTGAGLPEASEMLERYREAQEGGGGFAAKRRRQAKEWMHDTVRHLLEEGFFAHPQVKAALPMLETEVEEGRTPPTVAASKLIALYLQRPPQ